MGPHRSLNHRDNLLDLDLPLFSRRCARSSDPLTPAHSTHHQGAISHFQSPMGVLGFQLRRKYTLWDRICISRSRDTLQHHGRHHDNKQYGLLPNSRACPNSCTCGSASRQRPSSSKTQSSAGYRRRCTAHPDGEIRCSASYVRAHSPSEEVCRPLLQARPCG